VIFGQCLSETDSIIALRADVAAAAVESYGEVLEELEVTLTDITDDWRKLRNALWLIEHLLACTPQLM
jgi:hypothetical protein